MHLSQQDADRLNATFEKSMSPKEWMDRTELYVSPRKLTALPSLSGSLSLTSLDLSGCLDVSDVSGISGLPALTSLDLSECKALTNISSISNLPKLETLRLSGCAALTDVSGISGLPALTSLNLSRCEALTDVSGIKDLPAPKTLNLSESLLATLGYSSLANPTDWDDSLSDPPGATPVGADTLQVSFYGAIVSILWCLISVLLNADAKKMLRRGGDQKRLMLAIATTFLGVAIVAILAAYFCAGMTSVSAQHEWREYLVVTPAGVWGVVFLVSLVVFLGRPDWF
ncbi:hypothetical protein JKP88DRAFT_275303 [Tribonema minus]|uniref:Uncharacterized protein n=1 Tax=Tribonema minus TaxID=303371 RepID=A0A835ZJZ6_9STRA|nr:hypothetical protein JKP88DRAFT_275303 [Tribonema minus]